MSKRSTNRKPLKAQDPAGPPYIGPLTKEVFITSKEPNQPPPIIREWAGALKDPGEALLLWAGTCRKKGEPGAFSWSWMNIVRHTESDAEGDRAGGGTTDPEDPALAAKVERLLSPLAHESRIRLMQVLYAAPCGATALAEATGLKGGNLYHHLRDLLYSHYIRERDGGYALTDLGRQLLMTFTAIAGLAVQDRGDQGLVVASA